MAAEEPRAISAADQFLERGVGVRPNRPLFQGDVFLNVPLPTFPPDPPSEGTRQVYFSLRPAVLLPHPCSCYDGDRLRPRLVVAPLEATAEKPLSKVDWTGTYDMYPLVEVIDGKSYRADLGGAQSIPSLWLPVENRVACLSLDGVCLLHQRLLRHHTRLEWPLANLKNVFQQHWDDVEVWEAWRKANGTQEGYERWKRAEQDIPDLGRVVPGKVISSRTSYLIRHLLGEKTPEEQLPE